MNLMKKVVYLLVLIIMITGCSSNKFEENYNNMVVNEKEINGYKLDLRIYGNYNDETVNKIIKIENYMNTQFKIDITDLKSLETVKEPEGETIYILEGKTYIKNEMEQYSETNKDLKYNDPSIYLNGLKNISKTGEKTKETIGENIYDVYTVTFSKNKVKEMLEATDIKNLTIENDVSGKIYINSEGYVYRVIYNIDNLTINANYYGINNARSISLPNNSSHGLVN